MILLDTNVISELLRPSPSPAVVSWVSAHPALSLFTSTITQAEMLYGVAVLPRGKRRDVLADAVDAVFREDFAGRVLVFDAAAARAYASIASARRAAGRPISQFDAQIAGIAASRSAALATRNTADFAECGIQVVDPWSGVSPGSAD